jgi:DNA primase
MASNSGASYFDIEWIKELWHVRQIYIVFDNDPAGRHGGRRVAKLFGNKAKVFCFDNFDSNYDPNDYIRDGGLGKDLLELVKNKSKYWFEMKEENK